MNAASLRFRAIVGDRRVQDGDVGGLSRRGSARANAAALAVAAIGVVSHVARDGAFVDIHPLRAGEAAEDAAAPRRAIVSDGRIDDLQGETVAVDAAAEDRRLI